MCFVRGDTQRATAAMRKLHSLQTEEPPGGQLCAPGVSLPEPPCPHYTDYLCLSVVCSFCAYNQLRCAACAVFGEGCIRRGWSECQECQERSGSWSGPAQQFRAVTVGYRWPSVRHNGLERLLSVTDGHWPRQWGKGTERVPSVHSLISAAAPAAGRAGVRDDHVLHLPQN